MTQETTRPSPAVPMVTIGLLWHSLSSGNLGVGALTESNIAIIKEVAESQGKKVRFLVLGTGADNLPALAKELAAQGHSLENHRIRIYRSSFRDQVRRCDLVIDIGEGDSFADIYGFKRFFYYWLSKNIICSLGKPLILAPQTIGPFNGAWAKIMAKQVMARCTSIFARDNLSSDYLKQLGVTGNTHESIDVAFKLPFTRKVFPANGKTRVGINVSGLLFNGGYTGANQFGLTVDYPAVIRQLIAWFLAQPDVEVHLIPHVIEPHMPVEDDVAVSQKLALEYPGVTVAPTFTRPSEAKSYIAGMDFFTGARMHACIAAFSSGTAVVPMAYSRKFNGLFGTLSYDSIADCKNETSENVMSKIKNGYEDRAALGFTVEHCLDTVFARILLYKCALEKSI
jgi:colanic acid/amylovoran biosynthesis protein